MIKNMKTAFTLAEMLISIVIIGVIASIAIPNLKETSDKSANIASMKKAYATATNAFAQIQAELGPPIYWTVKNSGDNTIENQRIFSNDKDKQLSWILKKYILSNTEEIPDDYEIKKLSGNSFEETIKVGDTAFNIDSAFKSIDGMYWFPSKTYSGCKYTQTNKDSEEKETVYSCGLLMVDTNGIKKPNRMGIDVFVFNITTDAIVPYSADSDCEDMKGNGFSCAYKIIQNGDKALDFIYE